MAYLFLDANGNDAPTCRECGSIMCRPPGSPPGTVLTCSNCGRVVGDALRVLRSTYPTGFVAIALAEARDEGHAAGRAEALEEAASFVEAHEGAAPLARELATTASAKRVIAGLDRRAKELADAIRALAGKVPPTKP